MERLIQQNQQNNPDINVQKEEKEEDKQLMQENKTGEQDVQNQSEQKSTQMSAFIENLRKIRDQQKIKQEEKMKEKMSQEQRKAESEQQLIEKFKEQQKLNEQKNKEMENKKKQEELCLKKKIEEKKKILQNDSLIKAQESLFTQKPIVNRSISPLYLSNKKKHLPTEIKYSMINQQKKKFKKQFKNYFGNCKIPAKKQVYKAEGETVFVYKQPPKHPPEAQQTEQKKATLKVHDTKNEVDQDQKKYKKLISDDSENEEKIVDKKQQQNEISKIVQKYETKEKKFKKQLLSKKGVDSTITNYFAKQSAQIQEVKEQTFKQEEKEKITKKEQEKQQEIEKTKNKIIVEPSQQLSKEDNQKLRQQQLQQIIDQRLSKIETLKKQNNEREGFQNDIEKKTNNQKNTINQQNEEIIEEVIKPNVDVNFLKKQYQKSYQVAENNNSKNQKDEIELERERTRDYNKNNKRYETRRNQFEYSSDQKRKKNNFIEVEDENSIEEIDILKPSTNFIKTQSQIIQECQRQILDEQIKEKEAKNKKETKSILKNGNQNYNQYSSTFNDNLKPSYDQKSNISKRYNKSIDTSEDHLNQQCLVIEDEGETLSTQKNQQFSNKAQRLTRNSTIGRQFKKIITEEDEEEQQQQQGSGNYEEYRSNKYVQQQEEDYQNLNYKMMNQPINQQKNIIHKMPIQIIDGRPIQIINERPIQIIDETQIQYYDDRQVNFINGTNPEVYDRLSRRNLFDERVRQQQPFFDEQNFLYDNPKMKAFRRDQYVPQNYLSTQSQLINDFNNIPQLTRFQNGYTSRSRDRINNIEPIQSIPQYAQGFPAPPPPSIMAPREYNLHHSSPQQYQQIQQKNSEKYFSDRSRQFEPVKQPEYAKQQFEVPKGQSQFLNEYVSFAKEKDRTTLAQMFEERNRFKTNIDSFY